MSSHERVFSNVLVPETAALVLNRITCFLKGCASWMRSCADYWAAAAICDSLTKLSDAELHKRGLSRATLAHDLSAILRPLKDRGQLVLNLRTAKALGLAVPATLLTQASEVIE